MRNHDVDITASVDFDWQSMGGIYVDWMNATYPGEDYVFISGTVDSVVCQTVEASLKEATEKAGKMKCADIRYGDYEPEKAANEVEDLVNSGLDFSVIGVINEDCAAAIITRLEDLNVADKYHVFAQNGSEVGAQLMKDGSLEFTIASSPGLEGAVAVFAGIDGVRRTIRKALFHGLWMKRRGERLSGKAFLIMRSFSKRQDRHLHRHQYGVWKR